jgi:serpin B
MCARLSDEEVSLMRRRILVLCLCVSALAAALAGCSWLWPDVPGNDSVAQSNVPRDLHPNVSEAALADLSSGNGAFAFDLYAQIADGDGNLFFSPFSISSALAMTYAGARNETETQMADALHFTLGKSTLHPAFNAVDLELESRNTLQEPYAGKGFELDMVNAVWGQRGFPFRDAYLATLAANYGAGLRLADFTGDPEGARFDINNWVSGATHARIEDLLPPGSVSNMTRLVLTNAVYFKAPWLNPFDAKDTKTEPFTLLSGSSTSASMMHEALLALYAQVGQVRAVELPYNGDQLSMLLLVPDAGAFDSFERSLTYTSYRAIVDALAEHQVFLGLPKFKFDYAVSPVDALRTLGMTDAFDPDVADFSGIDGARDLYISNILHKAFVAVDEVGTEAAAATAVVVGATAMPTEPVTLTINRPFLAIIRDRATDTILFLGRVTEP